MLFSTRQELITYAVSIVYATILALLIIIFVVQAFFIPTGSMRPTFEIQDRILVNKLIYHFRVPKRMDIIVFKYPVEPQRKFIKRVIGVGGDQIQIIRGQVYVNDEPLEEEYILTKGYSDYGPVVVPEDNYFVLGDNRNNSEDSRFWGFVPRENVIGQAFMIFWPLQRARLFIDR